MRFNSQNPVSIPVRGFRVLIQFYVWMLMVKLVCPGVEAATPAETSLFEAAARAFQDRNYDFAEKTFAELVQKFPASELVPEAISRQGQARFELKNYAGVVEILGRNLEKAGALADEYQYWIGQAELQRGNFTEAAGAFGQVVQKYPTSKRRLDSAFGESVANFRRGDLKRAADLIIAPASAFQQLAANRAREVGDVVFKGYLLAAEALLGLAKPEGSLEALLRIEGVKAAPSLAWQREHAVFRSQLALSRTNLALRAVTNLVLLAQEGRDQTASARSHAALGGLLSAQGDFEGAYLAFTNNLMIGLGEEFRREAIQRVVALRRQQGRETEGSQFLEAWAGLHPEDKQVDLVRVSIADLKLSAYWRALDAGSTNAAVVAGSVPPLVSQSLALLDGSLTTSTNSPWRGRAFWLRGWCHWALSNQGTDTNRITLALADFESAAPLLGIVEDQTVSRFKAGDCALILKEFPRAAGHYQAVVQMAENVAGLKAGLMAQALYKLAESALAARDVETAMKSVDRILKDFPESEYGDRGMLHVGQGLSREGRPGDARMLFQKLLERMPSSPLVPEVRMAIARSYVRESKWEEAATEYDRWLGVYTNHTGLVVAEFDRAYLTARAGNDARASEHFASYAARFPSEPNAAWALMWLGDRAYNRGDFVEAEKNFQRVAGITNAPVDVLIRSRISAGRTAFARLDSKEARKYLAGVISDTRASPEQVAESLFAIGDTFMLEPEQDPNRRLENYAEAIKPFSRVAQTFSTNELAAMAWCKVGHCHMQLAAQDVTRYEQSAQAYTNSLTHPLADLRTRCEAEFGLGVVREKQLQPQMALEHFSNILYGRNLRPGERPESDWLKQAGEAAVRVGLAQKNLPLITGIYERLIKELPEISVELKSKLDNARTLLTEPSSPGS